LTSLSSPSVCRLVVLLVAMQDENRVKFEVNPSNCCY
jgi:hypothetical protein